MKNVRRAAMALSGVILGVGIPTLYLFFTLSWDGGLSAPEEPDGLSGEELSVLIPWALGTVVLPAAQLCFALGRHIRSLIAAATLLLLLEVTVLVYLALRSTLPAVIIAIMALAQTLLIVQAAKYYMASSSGRASASPDMA